MEIECFLLLGWALRGWGLAHLWGQRHPVVKRTLASNHDFSDSPVDIIEPQGHHLADTETETGQQKKNGVVAAAARGATVAGSEYTVDFFPGMDY